MGCQSHLEMEGMEFFAYHGCHRDEELNGNYFSVDLILEADLAVAAISDRLEDTLDYVHAYKIVRDVMDQRSSLLENVCYRMLENLFGSFPQLQYARVKLSKFNPDIGGDMKRFSVVMEKTRKTD